MSGGADERVERHLEQHRAQALRHREGTAVHEAGHAAMVWVLDGNLSSVSIDPGVVSFGHVVHGRFVSEADLQELEVATLLGLPARADVEQRFRFEAMVLLAGTLAEQRARAEGLVVEPEPEPEPEERPAEEEEYERELRERERVLAYCAVEAAARDAGDDSMSDRDAVAWLLKRAYPFAAQHEARLHVLYLDTLNVVRGAAFWGAVLALRPVLLEREVVDGDEAVAIMAGRAS